jgi:hypothetical protein
MSAIAVRPQGLDLLKPKPGRPEIIDVPGCNFLMVDGHGDPNTSHDFQDAIGALYSLAYGAKFALKKEGVEVRVMPLEALWWTVRPGELVAKNPAAWEWTAMILEPEPVTKELVERVRTEAARKKPSLALGRVRFERFDEGKCAQVMHVGPYSAEEPTIKLLHEFIADQGFEPTGRHHEIYLGDPRRAAPARLRTIVRQPIRAATSRGG